MQRAHGFEAAHGAAVVFGRSFSVVASQAINLSDDHAESLHLLILARCSTQKV
jgi:hypothetical protein|tara:strand:+ start:61 stop:219 length:159 start_codon:yes stop_codon:yes gene_type:complete